MSLMLLIAMAPAANARLFRQTYGAVVPAGGASDSTVWNTSQDYFVPRYPSSTRYGLFSSCKASCTTSPACWKCHREYPGYCSPYASCRYCWRDHVYRFHCGTTPHRLYRGPYRNDDLPVAGQHRCSPRHGQCGQRGHAATCGVCERYGQQPMECLTCDMVPNLEPTEFAVLGSIPAETNPLLTGAGMGSPASPGPPGLQPMPPGLELPNSSTPLPQFGLPQTEDVPQPNHFPRP